MIAPFNTLARILTVSALALSTVTSLPAFLVMDDEGGELVLASRVAAQYDSNIFANAEGESDLIWSLRPLLQFRREAGLVHFHATAGLDLGVYSSNSEQNYEDFRSNISISFPNGVSARHFSSASLSFNQNTLADPVVGEILQLDEFQARFRTHYQLTDRIKTRLNLGYYDRNYNREGSSNFKRSGVRFEGVYRFSDKLDLYGGYRYRGIDNGGILNVGGSSNLFLVGAEGELAAKLLGRIELGIQSRSYDIGLSDQTEPYFDIGLSWSATERVILSLDVLQDFEVTANNLSVNPLNVELEALYDWNDKIDVACSVAYLDLNYTGLLEGRNDEVNRFRVRVDYDLTKRQSLDFSLSYSDRSSSLSRANYDRIRTQFGYSFIF